MTIYLNSVSLINNLSGKNSMSKTSFCEISDLFINVTCEMKLIKCGQSTFRLGTIGMAMRGHYRHCVCVCGGGGEGTGRSEVGSLSISASVFTVWGTSVSAEGVTLFSEGSGRCHHWGGHHSYIVGVWGQLAV